MGETLAVDNDTKEEQNSSNVSLKGNELPHRASSIDAPPRRPTFGKGWHSRTAAVQQPYRYRDSILKREEHKTELDRKEILRTVHDYNEYADGLRTLRNLPPFDDCGPYVQDPALVKSLIEKEVDKLIAFATSESPSLFDSLGCLQTTNRKGFGHLSGVGDQIFCNLSILQHDNARNVVGNCRAPNAEAWSALIKTRQRLKCRFGQDDGKIEGNQPLQIPDPKVNFKAYCQLVDYILGILGWWLVRSVHSNYLKNQVFAILGLWAVKLKVVASDPVGVAEKALAETSALILQRKSEAEWKDDIFIFKLSDQETQVDAFGMETDLSVTYFWEKWLLRCELEHLFTVIIAALDRFDRLGAQIDCFEICTLMYRTGLGGVTTMLTGTRSGNVYSTSNLTHVNFSYTSYLLLQRNTKSIQETHKHRPPRAQPEGVTIDWLTTDTSNCDRRAELVIDRMDEVISLLVPIALLNPHAADRISELSNIAEFQAEDERIGVFEPPPRNFSMEYVITTKAWKQKMACAAESKLADPDVQQLSESPLRRGNRTMPLGQTNSALHANGRATKETAKIMDTYKYASETMSSWKIAPTTIRVDCRGYVMIIGTIAVLMVIGGLVIPFVVQDRIAGVDPFNISLFTWLLASAVLVTAKSRYVNSWPWHDFLKGRVVCRSLSDLSDATGIDAQTILLFLLHNEWRFLLVTSGPYNGMFIRRCDPRSSSSKESNVVSQAEGFSIDEPIHLSTMFASGFVILKVASQSGEDLICVDGRKGAWDFAHRGRVGNWMCCRNFNEDLLESARDSGLEEKDLQNKVFYLQRMEFSWNKVLGVYVRDSRFG